MSDEVYGELGAEFIEGSLCYDCIYRISREIKPLESTLDMWEESLGIDMNSDTILETHCCEYLAMDLDHIVIKCNKYRTEETDRFMNNINKFRNIRYNTIDNNEKNPNQEE